MLREGFDVEAVSEGWSIDLECKFPPPGRNIDPSATTENGAAADIEYDADGYEIVPGSAVTTFEASVRNPSLDALQMAGRDTHSTTLEVETQDTQGFLAAQATRLEAIRQKMEEERQQMDAGTRGKKQPAVGEVVEESRANVSDHIGPVQFNVGGIQVDADDMMKRLQVGSLSVLVNKVKKFTDLFLLDRIGTWSILHPSLKMQQRRLPINSSPSTRKTCRTSSRT